MDTQQEVTVYDGRPARQPLPKVSLAEELMFTTDSAPIIRLVGGALSDLHSAMVHLSDHINEAQRMQETDDEPEYLRHWRGLFAQLAPAHDGLLTAYRACARQAAAQAEKTSSRPDSELSAFVF